MHQDVILSRVGKLLLLVAPLVSLAVSPSPSFDPINPIKALFLSSFAFTIFGLLVSRSAKTLILLPNYVWAFSILFIVSLFATLVMSGAPLGQQFWGTFGRNTGLLTYVSLLFLLLGSAIVQKQSFYKSLTNCLILTSLPISLYSLIQILDMDPIEWSSKDTFATFGNTNFLSAFLGLTCVASMLLTFDKSKKVWIRISLALLTFGNILIILDTDSIQGFMILIAGAILGIYLWIRSIERISLLKFPYFALSATGFILSVLGVLNKGPLASFIFQPSVIFRGDYWHAGWEMTLRRPFFGVGLDSYGDWYREVRGSISTLRTGPERTANTAHNIFLDMSANGGFPLLIAYLGLLGSAFYLAMQFLRKNKQFDPYFGAIFCAWAAYQIQALVSINQIGVGVWGWILNGALIGYSMCHKNQIEVQMSKSKKERKAANLPASSVILAVLTSVLGFSLAYLPFSADKNYKTALQGGNLAEMMISVDLPGSTSWHLSQVLNAAVVNNFPVQAKTLTTNMLQRYPRDPYGWKILYSLTSSTTEERELAVSNLRKLDPFNPELPKS